MANVADLVAYTSGSEDSHARELKDVGLPTYESSADSDGSAAEVELAVAGADLGQRSQSSRSRSSRSSHSSLGAGSTQIGEKEMESVKTRNAGMRFLSSQPTSRLCGRGMMILLLLDAAITIMSLVEMSTGNLVADVPLDLARMLGECDYGHRAEKWLPPLDNKTASECPEGFKSVSIKATDLSNSKCTLGTTFVRFTDNQTKDFVASFLIPQGLRADWSCAADTIVRCYPGNVSDEALDRLRVEDDKAIRADPSWDECYLITLRYNGTTKQLDLTSEEEGGSKLASMSIEHDEIVGRGKILFLIQFFVDRDLTWRDISIAGIADSTAWALLFMIVGGLVVALVGAVWRACSRDDSKAHYATSCMACGEMSAELVAFVGSMIWFFIVANQFGVLINLVESILMFTLLLFYYVRKCILDEKDERRKTKDAFASLRNQC